MGKQEHKNDPYKSSGVDIEKGDRLVDWLMSKPEAESFPGGQQVEGIGSFSGLWRPNFSGMTDPLLVASTDGVGTKLLLAIDQDELSGIGIDLVAMCANDLYCVGARPMFFVDYYATGALSEDQFKRVLSSIRKGLEKCQTCLLGGETAELPGLYEKGHFDLAGFVVGVVDAKKKLGPHLVRTSDLLFALPSTGFHSNGYSLIRKWLKEKPVEKDVLKKILEPTQIYSEVPDILKQLGHGKIHAIANITGGGISGNLPRVMPEDVVCRIEKKKIPTPAWMSDFVKLNKGNFNDIEPVFNFGAGMIIAVGAEFEREFISVAREFSLAPVLIGSVEKSKGACVVEYV